jgi:hypothetical protein
MHWTRVASDGLTDAFDAVQRETIGELVQSARLLSATLDKVTTANGQSPMSLHLYWCSHWERRHAFIDMPKIEGAPDAETLFNLFLKVVKERVSLSPEQLARKLVQLACDGASVLQGTKPGLGVRLLAVVPFLFIMHCHAHRLDLVTGTLRDQDGFKSATAMAPAGFYARSTRRLEALKDVCLSSSVLHTA